MRAILALLILVSAARADEVYVSPPRPNYHEFRITGYEGLVRVVNDWHDPAGAITVTAPTSVWSYGPGDLSVELLAYPSGVSLHAPFQTQLAKFAPLFYFYDANGDIESYGFRPRVYELHLSLLTQVGSRLIVETAVSLPLEGLGPLHDVRIYPVSHAPEPAAGALGALILAIFGGLRRR